ncbi:oligogalacturonide transport system substrate-binding protein [Natranaerovirga pectinivora]|uniref:Oligogalacturonide transport system substrate-binding protein n=1 Tax=Natranaerovirga pectinivora TaxID=682400 RepID=A0A4R3MIK5_9FIRM|nr:extracellular solute-binding protein [Natranaerovirga pectinivora]TCT12223.1 oligogalacturonide transport system substrate-binding protein [Natranaerovirga pectinivora]
MKKVLALMVVLVLMTSLVGCGQKEEQTTPSPSTPTVPDGASVGDEEINLRFSWWGGDARHEATLEVIRLFEEANPNIKVEPEYTAWSGHFERIAAQLTARDEADLMQINFNWFYGFSPDGDGFYDLRELDHILNLNNWPAESFEPITINGKIQGIPTSIGARIYYLNKTMYDRAGVGIPETWDDLMAAGRAFRDNLGPDYYPIGNVNYGEGAAMMTFGYLAQKYGKDIFEGNEMAYTVDELADGFRFMQDLLDNHVIPDFHFDSANRNHENPNWISGRYAGVYLWNSNINVYAQNIDPATNPNVVAAPFIKLGDNDLHSGVFSKILMAFSISNHTNHPEEAAMLLNFLYTDKEAVLAHGLQRAIPLNKIAEEILAAEGQLEGLQYEGHVLTSQTATYSFHPFFEDNTVRSAYSDVFDNFVMMEGSLTPEAAAQEVITNFNRAVREAMSQ